jgi:hypothetical protein
VLGVIASHPCRDFALDSVWVAAAKGRRSSAGEEVVVGGSHGFRVRVVDASRGRLRWFAVCRQCGWKSARLDDRESMELVAREHLGERHGVVDVWRERRPRS